mgnify:CR=1 FL=1
MRILEEFWYGNIEPSEYEGTGTRDYKEALQLVCRNEEKLRSTMTDEQKDWFDRYLESVRELQCMTECLIFQSSFKLGARIMLEVIEE